MFELGIREAEPVAPNVDEIIIEKSVIEEPAPVKVEEQSKATPKVIITRKPHVRSVVEAI